MVASVEDGGDDALCELVEVLCCDDSMGGSDDSGRLVHGTSKLVSVLQV